MMLAVSSSRVYHPEGAQRAGRQGCRRRHGIAAVARPQQPAHAAAAPAPRDRRTLLLGAAALLAGAAVQRSLPAVADEGQEFQTAPNGLQWVDTVEGSGEAPVQGARIRAHYRGRLQSNGVVFDSSYERGKPLIFQVGVGQVIKGWDQGILGGDGVPPMKAGGKRTLIIPAELGYGARGAGGGVIPPNATLVFEVEFLGVQGRR